MTSLRQSSTLAGERGWCRVLIPACIALAALASPAHAQVTGARATPFPAWEEPKIDPNMTVEQAKKLVVERTRPQTEWKGPTSGPKAPKQELTLAWVSGDESYTSYIYWGNGIKEAANALGWKVVTLNGQGTVSGQLAAMQQALALNPAAIITPADANALQKPIQQAVASGIPVIGIHATAFPGPNPDLGLYLNIASNPAEIGQSEAAYVIANSDGKASDLHMVDSSYAIARFKAKATIEPIKNCAGCKFLEEVNVPIGESQRIASVVSGLIARYGDSWWMTTCCDGYYPYVAAALRSSGSSPEKIRLVGADGPPSAYDMIRKGGFEVATVPEPSTLFGYEAVDAAIRAFAGQPPAEYVQPTFLVTKDNVDSEGGKTDQFIPSNNFACHYKNIWLGDTKAC
jgi:ribose transport system substrate-binding protein